MSRKKFLFYVKTSNSGLPSVASHRDKNHGMQISNERPCNRLPRGHRKQSTDCLEAQTKRESQDKQTKTKCKQTKLDGQQRYNIPYHKYRTRIFKTYKYRMHKLSFDTSKKTKKATKQKGTNKHTKGQGLT